ncbi:MAG: hypothetical protein AB1938_10650 [Myxococcota bacterium]
MVSLPRAVRALLEVHLRTAFNAGLRNAGLAVTTLALLGALALWLLLLVPLCAVGVYLGVSLASNVDALSTASGALYAGAPLFGAVVSLMTGDTQELDFEKLEPYPMPPWALFFAELLASFVHPVMAVAAGVQLSFAAGALGSGAGLGVLVALVTGLTLQAAVRSLLASGAARLIRRAQAFVVFGLAAGPVAFLAVLSRVGEERADELITRVGSELGGLPGGLQATVTLRTGLGPGQALLELLGPLAAALLLLVLAGRVARRARSAPARTQEGPARLWTFGAPVWGVARLQLSALWATELGRFTVFLPLLWVVFLPLRAQAPGVEPRPELVSLFIWVILPTTLAGMTLNQFGLDRGGVKALFLLPLSEADVLYGKALGLGALLLAQASIAALLVGVLVPQHPAFLVAGPALTMTVGGLQLLIGQWTSLAWPRPIPRKGLKQPAGSVLMSLVIIATLFGTVAPLGLVWWALGSRSPVGLALAMLGLAAAVAALHRVFTPLAARAVAVRREHLVEALS